MSHDRFPKTTSGKIQRIRLKTALEAGGFSDLTGDAESDATSGPDIPGSEVEKRVAALWREVLGTDIPGRNTHLFELGCDSLKATQIVTRVREEWKAEILLTALFDGAGTVAGMAKWIAENAGGSQTDLPPPILPAPRTRRMPLSYSQMRLWLAEQIDPGTSLYHICRTLALRGPLQFQALEKALREIVRRHEILRTVYRLEDIPVQEVLTACELTLPRCDLTQVAPAERQHTAENYVSLEVSRPFDLSAGPVFRARLLKLASDEHLLVIVFHQILTDAWSLKVFFHELRDLYAAFATGAGAPMASLAVQYADYSTWQQRWFSPAALEPQLNFWRSRFPTPLPQLDLSRKPRSAAAAVDHLEPGIEAALAGEPAHAGWVRHARLEPALMAKVRSFCAQENVTLHMVLLAGFQCLLACLSGQREIVVGSPESGRHRREIEGLLGCFMNILLLRAHVSPNDTFRSLVKKVRGEVLDACMHADVPFEHVMQVIPENGFRDRPFQAWFGPIDSLEKFEMAGVEALVQPVFPPEAQFDLSCFLSEQADSATCFFECRQDVFSRTELARLLEQYQRLVAGLISAPDAPLDQHLAPVPGPEPSSFGIRTKTTPSEAQQAPDE